MYWTYGDQVSMGQVEEQQELCPDGYPPDRIHVGGGQYLISCGDRDGVAPRPVSTSGNRDFASWLSRNQGVVAAGVGVLALVLLMRRR